MRITSISPRRFVLDPKRFEPMLTAVGNKKRIIYSYKKWHKEIRIIHNHPRYIVCIFNTRRETLLHLLPIDNKLEALCYARKKKKWLIFEPHPIDTVVILGLAIFLFAINIISIILRFYG